MPPTLAVTMNSSTAPAAAKRLNGAATLVVWNLSTSQPPSTRPGTPTSMPSVVMPAAWVWVKPLPIRAAIMWVIIPPAIAMPTTPANTIIQNTQLCSTWPMVIPSSTMGAGAPGAPLPSRTGSSSSQKRRPATTRIMPP